MSGTDPSSPIDFTMGDDEDNYDNYGAASDIKSQSSLKASLKRRLSNSLLEDLIDHDQLIASIEEDVLDTIRVRPTWSFGRICKPNASAQQKSMTLSSSQDSEPISTQPSQASLDNESAFRDNQACARTTLKELEFSRASYMTPPNTEDIQMLEEEPSLLSIRPAKRHLHNPTSGMPPTPTREPALSRTTFQLPNLAQNSRNDLDIGALFPVRDPKSVGQGFTIPVGADVIDIDAETGRALEDEHRYDAFESDYLDEKAFLVFLANQRRRSPDNKAAQSIEQANVQDAAIVDYPRQTTVTGRRKDTAQISQLKTVPIIRKELQRGGHTYKSGKCVEMHDGTFIRITAIHKDSSGEFWLVGDLLMRTNYQGPVMPKRRNEVAWMVITNDPGHPEQAVIKRKLAEVRRIRKINFTNQQYEMMNTGNHKNTVSYRFDDIKFGELFCRIQRIQVKRPKDDRVIEDTIVILDAAEANKEHRINPKRLRDAWRGIETIPGGSFSQTHQIIDLDGKSVQSVKTKMYTLGDGFCGAGGVSRGALQAGLRVVWGFDFDENAIMTYRANFEGKGTRCYHEAVDVFLDRVGRLPIKERKQYMVDIMHISPPCQPFSPAHTVPNWENDAKNQACLFSVLHLLQAIKPRIVTVEETEGLLSRHSQWLMALIHIFVYAGYSVRWKVVHFDDYGVPQLRKRLFIIAAGPGEKLPEIVKPTHGGPQRPVTIAETLRSIGPNATHREVHPTNGKWPRDAYSSDRQAKTITCNGGDDYHPSGLRNFTIRELASLQTFPDYHDFKINGVSMGRRQIGNAVPPLMAKVMYKNIIESLEETDGVRGRRN